MDSVFESGLPALLVRLNQLRADNALDKTNEQIVSDIFAGFEFNYQPHAFQTDSGLYFPSMKGITFFLSDRRKILMENMESKFRRDYTLQ